MNYKKPAFWIVGAAILTCIIVAVCFLTNPKELSSPVLHNMYTQNYVVDEVTYESGSYSLSMVAGENTPIYFIGEGMGFLSQKEHGDGPDWTVLGQLKETKLTKENFDDLFLEPGIWAGSANAKRIRGNTVHAWKLIFNENILYYVLQQKNGDLYLAYGYTGFSNNDDNYTHIRWLYKLAVDTTGEDKAEIIFTQYDRGTATKTVKDCAVVHDIIYALETMKETGETVPKLSDKEFDKGSLLGVVKTGTTWIETGDKIYRLTPDFSQICLVETYLGEGKVLEITDKFKKDVRDAWLYAPYDSYIGTYNQGDDTVELKHVFEADSSVRLHIKDIYIESKIKPKNSITVELTSTVDQTVRLELFCRQSIDNLGGWDNRLVELKKGVPTTVELTFGGWESVRYLVSITAGNTMVGISVCP